MNSSSPSSDAFNELPESYPRHIAIIMDGNGRWAYERGVSVAEGHKEGGEAVQRCVKVALKYGIPFLTLYAFSSENWRRSKEEVGQLTTLLRLYLKHQLTNLLQNGVRLRIIGEPEHFGDTICKELRDAEKMTAHNTRLTVLLALSYGGRAEIVGAVRNLAKKIELGQLKFSEINEDSVSLALQTHDIPDPDIIARTSGEKRLSNFLLWQSAYAELVFLDIFWPDFHEENFNEIIDHYIHRQRRFGGRPI